jgi:hypothetical protein
MRSDSKMGFCDYGDKFGLHKNQAFLEENNQLLRECDILEATKHLGGEGQN